MFLAYATKLKKKHDRSVSKWEPLQPAGGETSMVVPLTQKKKCYHLKKENP